MLTPPQAVYLSATAAAALYLVCSPRFNHILYRALLFHPWRLEDEAVAPPLSGVIGENVFFPSANGKLLNGWHYRKPDATYTVLFSHGNGGNVGVRTDLVQLLLQAGCSVFIYDYQGYGESHGKPTVAGICQDGVGAANYLIRKCGVTPQSLIFYGESLGAAVSAYLTTKFACKALILQSGFVSLRRIAGELFPMLNIYPFWLFPDPPLDTAGILATKHPPLLLLHGSKDTLIPYAHAEYLYGCAVDSKRLVALPQAGHANIYSTEPDLYVAEIAKFIASLE